MPVAPRVLLSIDYEPVFALFRHYDSLTDSFYRRELDGGFTLHALDPLLEQLPAVVAGIWLWAEHLLHPEAASRGIEQSHQPQVVVDRCRIRQLDHRGGLLENVPPTV